MIKPPSQAAQSEWIMMGPAHSWCQCGQLSLCSNSLVVQWGAGARAGAGSDRLGAMNTCRGPTQAACPPAAGRKAAGFAASQQEERRLVVTNGKDLILSQRDHDTSTSGQGPWALRRSLPVSSTAGVTVSAALPPSSDDHHCHSSSSWEPERLRS